MKRTSKLAIYVVNQTTNKILSVVIIVKQFYRRNILSVFTLSFYQCVFYQWIHGRNTVIEKNLVSNFLSVRKFIGKKKPNHFTDKQCAPKTNLPAGI
jgi:hypothetical protein